MFGIFFPFLSNIENRTQNSFSLCFVEASDIDKLSNTTRLSFRMVTVFVPPNMLCLGFIVMKSLISISYNFEAVNLAERIKEI